MNHQPTETPQSEYDRACREILESAVAQLQTEHTWNIYLNSGGGERAIAGDHHGRHLLELLQNARDAIFAQRRRGPAPPGRVLVGVTERGLIVANTGASFDLHRSTVREAVQYLQRSNKHASGYVGHKGIGLKSVLLQGGAFDVRTRVGDQALRAVFSRALTAKHLLARLARSENGLSALAESTERGPAVEDAFGFAAELPRLPLFVQPHPGRRERGPDTPLLEDLLADGAPNRHVAEGIDANGDQTGLDGYQTIVYLPYQDTDWDTLLRALGSLLPDRVQDRFERALETAVTAPAVKASERAWKEVAGLDPRVALLLGEIAELQLCRYEDGVLAEAIRYDFAPPITNDEPRMEITLSCAVLGTSLASPRRRFVAWSHPSPVQDEPVRLMAELPVLEQADWMPSGESHPLYMFYPIPGARIRLPVIVHGPFRVSSSRTDLADEDLHNGQVLDSALELLDRALPELMTEELGAREWMPWLLGSTDTIGTPVREPLQRFAEAFRVRLATMPVVPTVDGESVGRSVLFDPERPAAFDVLASGNRLHPNSVDSFLRLRREHPELADSSAKAVGLGDVMADLEALASHLAEAWKGEQRFAVPATSNAASSYFGSLMAALSRFREADPDAARAFAEWLGQETEGDSRLGIPLLPVRQDESVLLVRAEHRVPRGGRTEKASRVVFWRDPQTRDRVAVPAPPAGITVYLAERDDLGAGAPLLEEYWREWGTTRLRGVRDVFLRVADAYVGRPAEESVTAMGWLAERLSDARELDRDPLVAEPGAYRGMDFAATIPPWRDNRTNATRRRYAAVTRLGAVLLPASTGEQTARQLVFPESWAPVFEKSGGQRWIRWAEAIRSYARFSDNRVSTAEWLAGPDDERWNHRPELLAPLLLAMGVHAGPPLFWRWVRSHGPTATTHKDEGSLNPETSRRWAEPNTEGQSPFPQLLRRRWREVLLEALYHPALTAGHSDACPVANSPAWEQHTPPYVLAWTWFPDLLELAEGWSDKEAAHWRAALESVWPEMGPRLGDTAWACTKYHHERPFKARVPSVARIQLLESPLWPSRTASGPDGPRTPASLMVRWPEDITNVDRNARTILPGASMPDGIGHTLDVRLLDQLTPAEALRRLSYLLTRQAMGATAGSQFEIAPVTHRNAWLGCANRLTERLWASLEAREVKPGGDDERLWRLHDLGVRGGWLRGVDAGACDVAIRVAKGEAAALVDAPAVFDRRPNKRDLKQLGSTAAVVCPRGRRADMVRLAEFLGATRRKPSETERFSDGNDAPESERQALREAVIERLPLMLAVLRLNNREDLDPAAERVIALTEDLVGIDGPGPDGRWSGLTTSGRLGYSRVQVDAEEPSSAVYLLAPGLAEALGQPTAAPQFHHALCSPSDQVEALFEAQGISVSDIVETVAVLRAERRSRQDARRQALQRWLQVSGLETVPRLDQFAVAASDEPGRRRLLMAVLMHARARGEAYAVLTGAAREAAGALLPGLVPVVQATEPARMALGQWAISEAVERAIQAETLEEALLVALLATQAECEAMTLLSSDATLLEWVGKPSDGRFLIEWSDGEWEALGKVARERLETNLKRHPGARLRPLLEAEGPVEARAAVFATRSKVKSMLGDLERRLDRGEAQFHAGAFTAGTGRFGASEPIQAGSGVGGGRGAKLTPEQIVRGRIAERYVLEGCWRRFSQLSVNDRAEVIDGVLAFRDSTDTPVPWGTRARSAELKRLLRRRRGDLLECPLGSTSRESSALFRNLIDVSGERGPGFDIIDPFAYEPTSPTVGLGRVEVKAVLPNDLSPRVFLTTNEYHKARLDPETYVLRLIKVPADPEDLAGVGHILDIPDPVQRMDLTTAFAVGVSGGRVSLKLKLG